MREVSQKFLAAPADSAESPRTESNLPVYTLLLSHPHPLLPQSWCTSWFRSPYSLSRASTGCSGRKCFFAQALMWNPKLLPKNSPLHRRHTTTFFASIGILIVTHRRREDKLNHNPLTLGLHRSRSKCQFAPSAFNPANKDPIMHYDRSSDSRWSFKPAGGPSGSHDSGSATRSIASRHVCPRSLGRG